MAIPDANSAFVPPEKLEDYLINPEHPVGGPKARWFISKGYRSDQQGRLEKDLLKILRSASEYDVVSNDFGVKYIVRGETETPNGSRVDLVTVWIVEPDEPRPRLVTAYPDEETN